MAKILTAIAGEAIDVLPIKTALISVSDKTGIVDISKLLSSHGVTILSTGGTAKALRDAGVAVVDVSEYTGFPEILDGRVKTLHPKIHGGLLAVRGNPTHESAMTEGGITHIDLVIVNLYPFSAAIAKSADDATASENIDIGGPTMIRAAAKNWLYKCIITNSAQLSGLQEQFTTNSGAATSAAFRRKMASQAFDATARYDGMIADYFFGGERVTRTYMQSLALKYGCNPHQNPAAIGYLADGPGLPFTILNGTPGYINMLDAANAWQLAFELAKATGLAAAASFKHVSPAGAAVATPLSDILKQVYEVDAEKAATLTPVALAYLRARNADPMCSFGDFAAVSHVVDEATALILKPEVSDGIVAPGYTPEALAILKTKKSGGFIILQAKEDFTPPTMEYREVFGMMFAQRRNDKLLTNGCVTDNIVTAKKDLTEAAIRDLIVALISIKYTQSNSVGYAIDGQMIGVGAGQQSRVDCVKLAGSKVATWYLRQHPKVLGLKFKPTVKRQDRVNARVRYIEGDFTPEEFAEWSSQLETVPEPLTLDDKQQWLKTLSGVSLASDAFFPFRDSLDVASRYGVSYVVHAGGSVRDADVIATADSYGMVMSHSGIRLFHH